MLDSAAVCFNSSAMRLLAPAKINLHLRVGKRRDDGFHSLVSWFVTIGLFDNLVLQKRALPERSRSGADIAEPMLLECDLPGLPCDGRNLVVKVANGLAEELASEGDLAPIRAVLKKRIPMGAGLGGGSSDAARAILGLNQLWGVNRAADLLSSFAARFGSDLPFFLHGPSSICCGRGEIVQPIGKPAPRWAVLILPEIAMPTVAVYRSFDELGLGSEQDLRDEPDWKQWTGLDSAELLPRLVNDLEPAAFAVSSALGELRDQCQRALGRIVRMSGSGSSLFSLFDEAVEAKDVSAWLTRTMDQRASAVEISPNFRDDLNMELALA